MTRTLIDVDDEALGDAMAALGTTTKVATINEALRRVVAQALRAEAVNRLFEAGHLARAAVENEDTAWR